MPVQRQPKITSLLSQNTSESQKNGSEATNVKTKSKKPNPTSVKTDIIISIKTQHMENIISRVKNHEFRKYNISTNIERMWYSEICMFARCLIDFYIGFIYRLQTKLYATLL